MSDLTAGSIIKSYDFQGVENCYIIGEVVSVEDSMITAKVIRAVSEGVPYDLVGTFRTPVQGANWMDGVGEFERVVVIG